MKEEDVWGEFRDTGDILVWRYYKPGQVIEGQIVAVRDDWKFVEDTVPITCLRGGFRIGLDEDVYDKPIRRRVEYELGNNKICGK